MKNPSKREQRDYRVQGLAATLITRRELRTKMLPKTESGAVLAAILDWVDEFKNERVNDSLFSDLAITTDAFTDIGGLESGQKR